MKKWIKVQAPLCFPLQEGREPPAEPPVSLPCSLIYYLVSKPTGERKDRPGAWEWEGFCLNPAHLL